MTFVSAAFFIFLAVVLPVYYSLPHRGQNFFLLIASCVFYGWWDWRFLGLLLATSALDFIYGSLLDRERHPGLRPRTRRVILALSVTGNLAVLGFFKYYNFFIESFGRVLSQMGMHAPFPALHVILPIGISFYTFHEMSYTIDVYRGQFRSVRNFIDYMLYVCFFPHLVAGPIQRAANLLPQIQHPRHPTREKFYGGTRLALVGFFKKMVIADNLAVIVDNAFDTGHPGGAVVVMAVFAFAFQIYCDFSGYTDIARGVARMLAIEIPLNFKLPYFATNPREFWQRWHISLSTWLRDYLYIPLGGNRDGERKLYRNLFLTMVLGGLWHGASWHFVVWGAYHGILLGLYHGWSRRSALVYPEKEVRTPSVSWGMMGLFFVFTLAGWLIFRVNSIAQLREMTATVLLSTQWRDFPGTELVQIICLCSPIILLELYEFLKNDLEPWNGWPVAGRTVFYIVLIYAIGRFGSSSAAPFIYFQF